MTRPETTGRAPMGRLLSRKDLLALGIRFTPPHLRKLIAEEKFPRPVRLGERTLVWMETEIRQWVEERASMSERMKETGDAVRARATAGPRVAAIKRAATRRKKQRQSQMRLPIEQVG
jgi:predicted DNA-binding transcriptional regulator AlpA